MGYLRGLILTVGLVLLVTCSSAPKAPEEITEKRNQAAEYAEYGNSYYSQGKYDRAIEFFDLALAHNGSIDNLVGIVSTYNSLGKTYLAKGETDTAEGYLDRARELADELNDPAVLSQVLNNYGELNLSLQNFDKALTYFEEANSTADQSSTQKDRAVIFHNLGTVQKKLGNPDLSIGYYEQAAVLNTADKKYEELASNYYMIASVHSEQGDYVRALEFIYKALENDKKMENSLGIAKDYLALGLILQKDDSLELAYANLKRGLFVYRSLVVLNADLNIQRDVQNMLRTLIDLADKLGEEDDAADFRRILGESEG